MPTVPYANTIRCAVSGTYLQEAWANVWHFQIGTAVPFTATEATAVNAAIEDFYLNAETTTPPGIGTYRPAQSIVTRVVMTDLRVVPNPVPLEFDVSWVGTGGSTSTVPVDVACVISLRTAVAGKSGRGRIFLGPLANTAMTAATASTPPQFASAFRTDIVDAVQALNDGVQAALTPSANAIAVLSVVDGVSRPIIGVRIDARPDTMRSRDLQLTFPLTGANIT